MKSLKLIGDAPTLFNKAKVKYLRDNPENKGTQSEVIEDMANLYLKDEK